MTALPYPLGIQSYCFRGFKEHEAVIEKLKACGAEAIELCRVHVNFADPASAGQALNAYQSAGVKILSIGVERMTGIEEQDRPLFEFVVKAGASFISVTFSPDTTPEAFRAIEKMADQYDVRLAIHNHGGRHWLGNAETLRHIFNITSDRIGLCLDTAWALDAGEDPIKMVREFGNRLYGVHFKDFVFDRARHHQDVVVGTGNLNLADLRDAMRDVNFNGYAVIEYEGDVENPVPALRDCVERVNEVF